MREMPSKREILLNMREDTKDKYRAFNDCHDQFTHFLSDKVVVRKETLKLLMIEKKIFETMCNCCDDHDECGDSYVLNPEANPYCKYDNGLMGELAVAIINYFQAHAVKIEE